MRQEHLAGEKLFIDYAGQTVPILNSETGKVELEAQIFIATFGASNYSFAEATASQKLPDWIKSHIRALGFFGGDVRNCGQLSREQIVDRIDHDHDRLNWQHSCIYAVMDRKCKINYIFEKIDVFKHINATCTI